MRHWFVGCVLLLWAVEGFASTGAAVYGQPRSPAERMLNEMLNPAPTAVPPTTRPGQAQVLEPSGYVPKSNNSQLLREGTDVIARAGHLKKSPEGRYPLFVFDQQPNLSPIQPMLVLPNLQLMSMEDAASETRQNLKFTVSGIITEYRAKNYILLEPGPDEINRQTPSTSSVPASAARPAPAEQMLNAMLAADGPSSSRCRRPYPRKRSHHRLRRPAARSADPYPAARTIANLRSRMPLDSRRGSPAVTDYPRGRCALCFRIRRLSCCPISSCLPWKSPPAIIATPGFELAEWSPSTADAITFSCKKSSSWPIRIGNSKCILLGRFGWSCWRPGPD